LFLSQYIYFFQVDGPEDLRTVKAALLPHYEEKNEAIDQAKAIFGEDCEYFSYEVHNLKMIYMLVGKSKWNCIKGGNLFCKCDKRIGVKYNDCNQCHVIDNEEHEKLVKRAHDRYEKFKKDQEEYKNKDPNWDIIKAQNKWAQEWNSGFTGFGIDARLLPIERIRPDVMHLLMACTKRLPKHLRKMLDK